MPTLADLNDARRRFAFSGRAGLADIPGLYALQGGAGGPDVLALGGGGPGEGGDPERAGGGSLRLAGLSEAGLAAQGGAPIGPGTSQDAQDYAAFVDFVQRSGIDPASLGITLDQGGAGGRLGRDLDSSGYGYDPRAARYSMPLELQAGLGMVPGMSLGLGFNRLAQFLGGPYGVIGGPVAPVPGTPAFAASVAATRQAGALNTLAGLASQNIAARPDIFGGGGGGAPALGGSARDPVGVVGAPGGVSVNLGGGSGGGGGGRSSRDSDRNERTSEPGGRGGF